MIERYTRTTKLPKKAGGEKPNVSPERQPSAAGSWPTQQFGVFHGKGKPKTMTSAHPSVPKPASHTPEGVDHYSPKA